MTRQTTLDRLDEAMTRLLAGQPTCTDGELTVSNLCAEAGVGRDSYYRSAAIVEKFTSAKANAETRKPELVALREELAAAKRALKDRDREHAAERRELEQTVKTYANQIQLLALRISEVDQENQRLRQRLEDREAVTRIH